MKPHIDETLFGKILIDGQFYDHDVVINLEGEITKRKKKLSKEKYGTSHKVSLEEAKHIYNQGVENVIIGSGQYGMLKLSDEAEGFFKEKKCKIILLSTPEAIKKWNTTIGRSVAMFHITC